MAFFKTNQTYFWRMLWGSLWYAEWDAAFAKAGPLGWIVEFFRAITGFSAWPFFVPQAAGWTRESLQAVLAERGIVTWGWGTAGADLIFHVKLRHAHWAQYLLLEAGAPLTGRLLTGSGYAPRRRHAPTAGFQAPRGGYRPTRSSGSSHAMTDGLAPQPEPVAAAPTDPLGRINHLVDRLAEW